MPTEVVNRATGHFLQEIVVSVTASELTEAGTTQTVDLVTLPSDWIHIAAKAEIITTFADAGSISNVVANVGLSGDADALIDEHDVFGPAAGTTYRGGAAEGQAWDGVTVQAAFTSTGADLGDGTDSNLDAGEVQYRFFGYRVGQPSD